MKKLQVAVLTVALAQTLGQGAQAADGAEAMLAGAFAPSFDANLQADVLDPQAMADTRGKLAPLALVAAIGGLDLALIGVYWGVYVPHYGGGGSCLSCSTSNFSSH